MPSSTGPASPQADRRQTTSFQTDVLRNCRAKGCYLPMHGKPYKYGIPRDHISEGHLAEHSAFILCAATFSAYVNQAIPHKDI